MEKILDVLDTFKTILKFANIYTRMKCMNDNRVNNKYNKTMTDVQDCAKWRRKSRKMDDGFL